MRLVCEYGLRLSRDSITEIMHMLSQSSSEEERKVGRELESVFYSMGSLRYERRLMQEQHNRKLEYLNSPICWTCTNERRDRCMYTEFEVGFEINPVRYLHFN